MVSRHRLSCLYLSIIHLFPCNPVLLSLSVWKTVRRRGRIDHMTFESRGDYIIHTPNDPSPSPPGPLECPSVFSVFAQPPPATSHLPTAHHPVKQVPSSLINFEPDYTHTTITTSTTTTTSCFSISPLPSHRQHLHTLYIISIISLSYCITSARVVQPRPHRLALPDAIESQQQTRRVPRIGQICSQPQHHPSAARRTTFNLYTLIVRIHRYQNVLFGSSPVKDGPVGACMALIKHGAQALQNTHSSGQRKGQRRRHHHTQSSAHGTTPEWSITARCRENLQSQGALFAG